MEPPVSGTLIFAIERALAMLTRRQFQFYGAAALLGVMSNKRAAASQPIFGCTMTADQGYEVLNTIDLKKTTPTSGNQQLDYALAQTLSHLTDELNVLPNFLFYEEQYGFNARALPITRVAGRDGTVLFGRRMLKICLSLPEAPDAAIGCTCAHEFGHIVQYKRGLQPILMRGQNTVRRVELHADFLAGYFSGTRKMKRSDFPAAVFATTQYRVGDDDFASPTHHGTSEERAAAIVRGFEVAYREHLPLDDAIRAGIEYVSHS
jgi:hypothetical protein